MARDRRPRPRRGHADDPKGWIHPSRRTDRAAHRAPRPHARGHAEPGSRTSGGGVVTVAESRRDEILRWLDEVKDPEVPVLSIRELGVLRDVEVTDDAVVVVMTPTYSGCPAMHAMEAEVIETLARHGVPNARVKTVYAPDRKS